MPTVVTEHSQELTLQLVHAHYPVYNPGTVIYFEYSPVTGFTEQWVPPGGSPVNYYKDEGAWRFYTNQANAPTAYPGVGSPGFVYVRPDTLPGWSWSLADVPNFPVPVASTAFPVMIVQARVIGGGEALELEAGETLVSDYVTLRLTHATPSAGTVLALGAGGVNRAGTPGRHTAWENLVLYPNLIGPGGVPVPLVTRSTSDGAGGLVRESDFAGDWMALLTTSTALAGAAISPDRSLGFHVSDPAIDGPMLSIGAISATRHWTISAEETETPTALLESSGEASSAASVRVQALPATSPSPSARAAAPRLSGPSMALGSTPPVGVRIYQPRAVFDQEPWIVAGGRAERAPALGINAHTWAYASSYDSTEGVEDALSVTLGATRRWVADPATYNTATNLWSPANGPTTVKFKGKEDGNQYIDPGYEYDSRIGVLQRNAMVFAGGAWFTATGKMSGGDEWAISMVMVVHANDSSTRATILQSFQDDPSDPDNWQHDTGLQDLCLDITGDKLMIRTGGRQTYDTLRTISDRPIIVVISGKARRTRLLVVDRKYASHDFRHSDVGPTDMRFLLGRPNVEITRRRGTARMDLMEIATFNNDLGPKEMWQVASKLDSVYGVSR